VCHASATQTWGVRRVDQPVPGVHVRRVLSSRCPRGCLDDANPWILTEAFPSLPAYPPTPITRVSYPDPAAQRRRPVDDDDDL